MLRPLRLGLGLLVFAALVPTSRAGRAQVNSDYGIQAGVMQRITTGGELPSGMPTPGPMIQAQGHLAVLPMIRVGLYASWDNSPVSGGWGTRNFYELGLRVKFTPPLLSPPWKAYAFAGFGAAYGREDSFVAPGATTQTGVTPNLTYSSIDGYLLETPVGLGLAYKVSKGTEIFAELTGRFGVAFIGTLYAGANQFGDTATAYEPQVNPSTIYAPFQGQDSAAVSLSVGISFGD